MNIDTVIVIFCVCAALWIFATERSRVRLSRQTRQETVVSCGKDGLGGLRVAVTLITAEETTFPSFLSLTFIFIAGPLSFFFF